MEKIGVKLEGAVLNVNERNLLSGDVKYGFNKCLFG